MSNFILQQAAETAVVARWIELKDATGSAHINDTIEGTDSAVAYTVNVFDHRGAGELNI